MSHVCCCAGVAALNSRIGPAYAGLMVATRASGLSTKSWTGSIGRVTPNQLAGAIGPRCWAAAGSFVAFGVGAAIPVLPYLLSTGSSAFLGSIGLSIAALFGVGAGVSLLTGRSAVFSGGRQVLIGAAAATVTYLVGLVIGVSVGG